VGTDSRGTERPDEEALPLQVVDDILDITQTTEQLGKTAGKDLASSKTTYPSILGLEQVPRAAVSCGFAQVAVMISWEVH
jgi:Polyprenyl synthetase